ncbi:hypothetical protein CEP52_016549 [Fusarium oligoseptatum]|uniref:Uncharacterized protein n=1 Tax=Fusarium oligoseptatum TaxID=2604345 RepID=A0A428S2H0_9HYPO|nr:hypothetical protein CEP52_016549 [Fusarium oligoseptatum]
MELHPSDFITPRLRFRQSGGIPSLRARRWLRFKHHGDEQTDACHRCTPTTPHHKDRAIFILAKPTGVIGTVGLDVAVCNALE